MLVGHLDQRHGAAEAGVVHGDVDPSEPRDDTLVQRDHLGLVADITGDRVHVLAPGLCPELFGGLPQPPLVRVGDDDRRALLKAAAGRG